MLRLYVNVKDNYLKVREAFPHEAFKSSCAWRGEIEFEYVQESNYMMAWTSLLPDLEPTKARALVELIGARYPVSPFYKELKALCPHFVFHDGSDEWVFFGGSFNPWHQGHQACLELLPENKTCFVLPDINPHKEEREFELVSTVLTVSSRARFRKGQFLVPTFLLNRVKNPTVDWIERLRQEYPQQRLSLLMGFDSFSSLQNWTRSSELLKALSGLYVVSRLETDVQGDEMVREILKLAPHLKIELLGRHGHEELSSTDLRRRL